MIKESELSIRAKSILNQIREYHWKIAELNRLKQEDPEESKLYAEYNIDRTKRRIRNLKKDVEFVQELERNTKTNLEQTIVNCMMDGMNVTDIAKLLNLSRNYIYTLLDEVISHEIKRLK